MKSLQKGLVLERNTNIHNPKINSQNLLLILRGEGSKEILDFCVCNLSKNTSSVTKQTKNNYPEAWRCGVLLQLVRVMGWDLEGERVKEVFGYRDPSHKSFGHKKERIFDGVYVS